MFSVFVHTKGLTQIKKGGFFIKKHVEIFFYIAEPAYLCIVKKTKRLLDCLG